MTKPWIETFNEFERHEYLRMTREIRPHFRNGPIWGRVVNLIIEEIIDKRKDKLASISTGPKPE